MYMYFYLRNCSSPLGSQFKRQVKLQNPEIAASLLLCPYSGVHAGSHLTVCLHCSLGRIFNSGIVFRVAHKTW